MSLAGAGVRSVCLPPCVSVDDLLAVAFGGVGAGGAALPQCDVTCEARRLRLSATLAAAGVEHGSLLVVVPALRGGMFCCFRPQVSSDKDQEAARPVLSEDALPPAAAAVQPSPSDLEAARLARSARPRAAAAVHPEMERYKNLTFEALQELLKGTPSERYGKYSITQGGMDELHRQLLNLARDERRFHGESLTSDDCAALFQGREYTNGRWSDEGCEDRKFHPMDKFAHLYSSEQPTRIQSYPWKGFSLDRHLKAFIKRLLEIDPPRDFEHGEPKFWIDVLFSDQNSHNIHKYLAASFSETTCCRRAT